MTLEELLYQFQQISTTLDAQFPMSDKDKRVFAKVTKMVEEFGELADMTLVRANLQRDAKQVGEVQTKLEDEFADVVSTLILLGLELNIDIEKSIQRNIQTTLQRLHGA